MRIPSEGWRRTAFNAAAHKHAVCTQWKKEKRGATLEEIMRYGGGAIPSERERDGLWDKRGLKLRVPSQFKTMERETKPPQFVVFEGFFFGLLFFFFFI